MSKSTCYAETVAGPVRVSLSKQEVFSLDFIYELPKNRKVIQIPLILKQAFSDTRIGNRSTLNPKGNQFQTEVWNALIKVPFGVTCTYGKIAERIGRPSHARAVAGAISRNKIAIIVPCHRIIPASGKLGGYRWGSKLKRSLLQHEKEGYDFYGIFKKFFECEKI